MFFFFNDTATTEIYTLSLHDALPIFMNPDADPQPPDRDDRPARPPTIGDDALSWLGTPLTMRQLCALGIILVGDRKSTRLNSSHANISYAVFCLKKNKNIPSCSNIIS